MTTLGIRTGGEQARTEGRPFPWKTQSHMYLNYNDTQSDWIAYCAIVGYDGVA